MFIDMTMTTVETDHRRGKLMAEAREYRLASLARAGRRALRRAADEAVAQMAAREGRHDRYSPPSEPAGRSGGAAKMCTVGELDGNRR
ncbi:hypothetical protein [Pseudonocardia lacus]|uniref:hypothetical protein n=1 Tax=Pseudonocardia lacus TaxID=2835865 RepID=UPI001BDCA033|nr:hypothetical protein [Pseudonocardia lacus]